ncbi:MAG TPA: trigger factor [Thermomicrobiaceae bacterium]|nr:trigger factor [Thermomicrobiaceae bacterium]
MRVTVEKQPQSSVTLDIAADDEEFGKAMDRAFRRVSQQVRIPGFRPGRAPRYIIEQRIGREAIVDEAQREIMDQLYRDALEQESIVPVSEPDVDIYQQEPVAFTVQVQVYPDVALGDYPSARVEPREVNVSDEDVQAVLDDLQKSHSIWVEPSARRAPHNGDQVIVDLTVTRDGEPFQEPLHNANFVLGESALFTQIEEAIKQLHPGEGAEFDITFAEDDEKASPDLRGQTLQYQITLNEIKERELPAIDDELAKSVGDYESIDELRAAVHKDLLRNRAIEARNEVVNQAIDAVAAQATIDIPSAMVDRQVEDDIERLRTRLQQQDSSLEEYLRFSDKTLEQYRAEQRGDAERRLRNSIVLEEFAKAEGIEVGEDDLLAEIDRLTAPSENAEQMREIYSSPYFRGLLTEELTNRRVTDRLIDLVTEGRGAVTGEGAEALAEASGTVEAEAEPSDEVAIAEAAVELEEAPATGEAGVEEPEMSAAPDESVPAAAESAEDEPAESSTEDTEQPVEPGAK